jgi:hypothetical protein
VRRLSVLLCLLIALAGCSSGPALPTSPPSPAPPVTSAPAFIAVPDVVGQNAAVALDRLHKLGFKNVDLGTVDGHEFVLLPQNWTVKTQSARPGDKIAADAKLVLGCARNS